MKGRCTILRGLKVRALRDIEIGHHVNINQDCYLDSRGGKIILKDYSDLSPEVTIWTLNHDIQDPNFGVFGGNVVIQEYAWICYQAKIMPGITIGEGAVVATSAVVTKDVEPWTVVGGVPAKKIGTRSKNQNPRTYYDPWLM